MKQTGKQTIRYRRSFELNSERDSTNFSLGFRCLINCKLKISPSAKLSVESHCQGKGCVNIHSYEWRIYEQTYDESNDIKWREREDFQEIASTPLNSSAVVIKENSLVGGKKYSLGLYVETHDEFRGALCTKSLQLRRQLGVNAPSLHPVVCR